MIILTITHYFLRGFCNSMLHLFGSIAWLIFWAIIAIYTIAILASTAFILIVYPILNLFFKKTVDEIEKIEV